MKLLALIDQLAAPAASAPATRRASLARLAQAGWRTAAAAVPAALLPTTPAAAGTLNTPLDAVLLLLQLARTQADLYAQGLAVSGLIPTAKTADFQTMQAQCQAHIALFARALTESSATVPPAPVFDFSGRRGVAANPVLFPGALTAYPQFLELAQQLADAGGRLCQGVLPALYAQRLLHTAAIQLLPVESRHASHLRTLRREQGATVKNWPTAGFPALMPTPPAALVAATSLGEEIERQLVFNNVPISFPKLLAFVDGNAVQASAVAEAFDEPIAPAVAQAALNLFVV